MKTLSIIRRRSLAKVVTISLAAIGLASSCSSGGATTVAGNGEVPFSIFADSELASIHNAVNVIKADCMATAGFPQLQDNPGPPVTQVFKDSLTLDDATFGARTEDEARQRGFGFDMAHEEPPMVRSADREFQRTIEECHRKAWDRFGADARATYEAYFDLGNQLSQAQTAAFESQSTRPLYEALLQCLETKNYRPENRSDYLNDHNLKKFGVEFGVYIEDGAAENKTQGTVMTGVEVRQPGKKYYRPTEPETRFAVAYFQCRNDLGFNEKMIQNGLEAQKKTVEQHQGTFLELNPKVQELAKQAASITDAKE